MKTNDSPASSIDFTPSWRSCASIIAAGLQDGTAKGKEIAREELDHMARVADLSNEALAVCQIPELDEMHDMLSEVLEDPASSLDRIRKAGVKVCLALNRHAEARRIVLAKAAS